MYLLSQNLSCKLFRYSEGLNVEVSLESRLENFGGLNGKTSCGPGTFKTGLDRSSTSLPLEAPEM